MVTFKRFVLKLCQSAFIFFLGSYVTAIFNGMDIIFVRWLNHFFQSFPENEAISYLPELTNSMANISIQYRSNLLVAYDDNTKIIVSGWLTASYLNLDLADYRKLIMETLKLIRELSAFMNFSEWARFWLVTLHPLMPWSFIYDSRGVEHVNGISYKTYIRCGVISCARILLEPEVGWSDRRLAYSVICRLIMSLYTSNKF